MTTHSVNCEEFQAIPMQFSNFQEFSHIKESDKTLEQ